MRFAHRLFLAALLLLPAIAFGDEEGDRRADRDRRGSSRIGSGVPVRSSPARAEAPSRTSTGRFGPAQPSPVERQSAPRTTAFPGGDSGRTSSFPSAGSFRGGDQPTRSSPGVSFPRSRIESPSAGSFRGESPPVRSFAGDSFPRSRIETPSARTERTAVPDAGSSWRDARRVPQTTDRFPTRTDRFPDATGRSGYEAARLPSGDGIRATSGFRGSDRVPVRETSGFRDSGSDRFGFYRPPIRTAPARDDRYDRHGDYGRHDGDRYRHSHRTVIETRYDRPCWNDWDWRGRFGIYVGFSWPYYYGHVGVSYSYGRYWWPFWYASPVCVAYVPFGFYVDREPVLVRETVIVEQPVIVEREVPVVVTERTTGYTDGALVKTSEYREPIPGGPAAPAPTPAGAAAATPPPVFDEATERHLRDGSDAFARADYEAAAREFRLAVVAYPDAAPPKFAFGQALIAIRDYAYAARILREAIAAEPEILNAPGSIAGVYRDPEEFQRVQSELKTARLERPGDPDLGFLVLYQQFFSGDVQAVVTFERLTERFPGDPVIALFRPALAERFPDFAKYPEPQAAPK